METPIQFVFNDGTEASLIEPDGTTFLKVSTTENSTAHSALPERLRRIVAMWNACSGIETAELEGIAASGGMLGPREDVARIAKQRDAVVRLAEVGRRHLVREWIKVSEKYAGTRWESDPAYKAAQEEADRATKLMDEVRSRKASLQSEADKIVEELLRWNDGAGKNDSEEWLERVLKAARRYSETGMSGLQ